MTDITLSSRMFCRPVKTPWGAFAMAGPQTTSTGASSITINIGRRLTLDYTGSTTVSRVVPSTAPNHFYLVGVAAGTIAASTHVAGSPIDVWDCNPIQEFRAVTFGATLASSHVGLRKKMIWDSTLNIEKIDLGASTNTDWRVVITGLIDAEGDSGGSVRFRFLNQMPESAVTSLAPSTVAFMAFYG